MKDKMITFEEGAKAPQAESTVAPEPRYFIDSRVGCIAVRDRTRTDPDYPGLHQDTEGVVWYAHGRQTPEGWTVSERDSERAKEVCDGLNNSEPAPSAPEPLCKCGHEESSHRFGTTKQECGEMTGKYVCRCWSFRPAKPAQAVEVASPFAEFLNQSDEEIAVALIKAGATPTPTSAMSAEERAKDIADGFMPLLSPIQVGVLQSRCTHALTTHATEAVEKATAQAVRERDEARAELVFHAHRCEQKRNEGMAGMPQGECSCTVCTKFFRERDALKAQAEECKLMGMRRYQNEMQEGFHWNNDRADKAERELFTLRERVKALEGERPIIAEGVRKLELWATLVYNRLAPKVRTEINMTYLEEGRKVLAALANGTEGK